MIYILVAIIYLLPLIFAIIRVYIFPEVPYKRLRDPNAWNPATLYWLAEKERHIWRKNALKRSRKDRREVNKWLYK